MASSMLCCYQSATKGYLAVYLIDDNKNAYCLLPYQSSKDGKVESEVRDGANTILIPVVPSRLPMPTMEE